MKKPAVHALRVIALGVLLFVGTLALGMLP